MTLSLAMSMGLTSVQSPPATAPADDTTPDAFDFTPVTGADRSTLYVSNIVAIAGINAAAVVSVAGGEYRKNGGSWTSTAGSVVVGDTLQVRGTSSASYTADVNVTLTVGGVADTFTITTEADPVAVSAIQSLTIMDATPLDATGAYGDATSRTGVNGDGWVAVATMPYLVAQTFDPSKIIHEVSDPGYDATGTTTVTRNIRGTVILRRQYNAAASKQQSDNGVTMTVYYALEDVVYEGSTLASATAEEGFYGASDAGSVSSLTNNSGRPYYKPLAAWFNTQHERATGGYAVELAAAHAHGMNGRMVARVEFIATDGTNTAATQTASVPSLSSIQTQGNITEAYKATIPVTALTQGAVCQVNAKIYPWIGDASAVLDLAVDGFAWPTANPQTPLRFWNDKSATRGAIAFVRAGAGGTPQVSKTEATARANPYATIGAAFTALATFNGGDHSGSTIYLMDDGAGGAVAHTIDAAISTTAGNSWTDIRKDPSATGAVSLSMTVTRGVPDKVRWFVDINHSGGNGFDGGYSGGTNKMLAFAGGTITNTTTVPLHYRNGLNWLTNVTIVATGNRNMMAGYANTRTQTVLALGVIAEGATGDGNVLPYAMIGCRLRRLALQEIIPSGMPSNDDQDGMFVMNTWFRQMQSSGTFTSLLNNRDTSRGMAIVQNLFEQGANQTGVRLGGDGTTMASDNVVFAYNSIVGGRINHGYTDVAGAAGVLRRLRMRFNLCNDTWNCKTDTFTTNTTATGRVGNWEHLHNVGQKGNVVTGGSANNSVPNADTSWLGPWWPAATYNVGAGNLTFTDDKSLPIGSGALGGTYSLTGATNAAYDQVAVNDAMLAYDIAGNARRNNGTGASGCYERAA